MYGFLITRGVPHQETSLDAPDTLTYGDIRFYYHPLPKFEKDHLFYEDDEKIVLLDGVIFNDHELMEARGCGSWRETVDRLILEDPRTFQKELRGSFCGALLQKGSATLEIFTNQSGEKAVYYAQREGLFVAASHNNILTAVLKDQGFPVEPDLQGCRELLCCGCILHGNTPFQGVRRLNAGRYLLVGEEGCRESRYHMFRNLPEHELTLEECIEGLDERFRKAVDRIFAKNAEYGYQVECDLSGGMDGRMIAWVAHDLGYRDILNICFSQSRSIDHKVSKQIARDLGNNYFFLPLDGGEFLMDIDEMADKFGGQVSATICTGAYRSMREVAARDIGLCATGLLADAYEATRAKSGVHVPPGDIMYRHSTVIPFVVPKEYTEDYANYEQMNLYEEDMLLFMSSVFVRQQVCEAVSPYVDVDFLEFAYRIPVKWRARRFLAASWIVSKYPEAAKYVWQHERKPIDKFLRHEFYFPRLLDDVCRLPVRLVNKTARILGLPVQFPFSTDMNPFALWYRTNRRLRRFIHDYYQENIDRISDLRFREDVRKTFEEGSPQEKCEVLDLLAVFKRYF